VKYFPHQDFHAKGRDFSEEERITSGRLSCINSLKRESLVMMNLQLLRGLIHLHE